MALLALSASLISPSGLTNWREKSAVKSRISVPSFKLGNGWIKCKAVGDSPKPSFQPTVYKGVYGSWTVEPSDVREVL